MDFLTRRQRRRADVRRRASTPDLDFSHCRAPGCPNPSRAGTSDGLGRVYCRSHYEHYQRHGSPFKKSYTAAQLNPYRRAALEWLLANEDEFWVKHSIKSVRILYGRAGEFVEAFSLRGLTPKERAKAHWARLRKHDVDPRLVVAAWLAVEMVVHDDTQPNDRIEFRRVQGAKVVHRMASGSRRTWGGQKFEVYPRPRGKVLRYIGESLQEACALLIDHHIGSAQSFMKERNAEGVSVSSPYPKGWVARRRS